MRTRLPGILMLKPLWTRNPKARKARPSEVVPVLWKPMPKIFGRRSRWGGRIGSNHGGRKERNRIVLDKHSGCKNRSLPVSAGWRGCARIFVTDQLGLCSDFYAAQPEKLEPGATGAA